MAQAELGGAARETSLFMRKATGLVRAWSVFDAFIYATFSINLVTLGLYSLSLSSGLGGNLITAVIVGGVLTICEVIVYANLIAIMPRAGGDYVWQSRILGGAVGFILAVTGWWFILWLWVPLYGQMLVYEFFTPILAILGARDAALWFTGQMGLLTGSLVCIVFVSFYISLGMKWYARIQKFCFWGGMLGLLLAFALLLFGSHQTFVNNLNTMVPALFGTQPGIDLYQATLKAGEGLATNAPLGNMAFGASFAIIPMIAFFNLWPNWGATLYGEVRGATDYKRNFWGMGMAVIITTVLVVIFLGLIAKTLGWDFYNRANGAFWAGLYGYGQPAPLPFWPYPGLFAAFMVDSRAVQFVVILLMSLWWFGWSATVFLSSTRVIFAAAFDRLLPERVADVTRQTRTPINALLLMAIPAVVVAVLYAFNLFGFQTLALDATLVIALTFFGTAIAAVILPWHKRELFEASPVARLLASRTVSQALAAVFAVTALWLIVHSVLYGITVSRSGITDTLTWVIVAGIWLLTAVNAAILLWILFYVGRRVLQGAQLPLVTAAGLVFLSFLDWLLIEWFWDPNKVYAIGWSNPTSIIFMLAMYLLAVAIYFGFKFYRRRQEIDIDKIYDEIPVE